MKRSSLTTAICAGLIGMAALDIRADAADGKPAIPPRMELRPLNAAATEYELLIYGDIGESWYGESTTAKSVLDQLNALADTVTTINVRINSFGGSVADGLAIHNVLRRHKATKAVTIDGVAMSSASLIAMAGDSVAMYDASMLMIHAPWTYAGGNAEELRAVAKVLDTYAEAMSGAYARKTGKPKTEMLALLLDGQDHYYTGSQALDAGFADELVEATSVEETDESADAAALLRGLDRYTASAPAALAKKIAAAVCAHRSAAPTARAAATNPTEETEMIQANLRNRRLQDPAGAASAGGGSATPAPAAAAVDPSAVLAADQARRTAIRALFAPHAARTDVALAPLQQTCEDDAGCTVEAAGLRLLAKLGEQSAPIARGPRVEPGNLDAQATYREAAVLSLLNRRDPRAHAADERIREFRGMTMTDMARDACARAGINTRGMSRDEIAIKAMHSTSDFPNILQNTIGRTLRAGYAANVRTFVPFCRQTTLPDFKAVSRVQLAGAPNLKRVVEGAEYEHGTVGDAGEQIRVLKYGRMIAITWETIINDDLDALTRIPQAFGASASDLESDLVYGIFTSNAAMADNVALFHDDHGNLGTAGALIDAISLDPEVANPLAQMREKMMLQTGIEGRFITVYPKYLIVPPALEEVALRVTSATMIAGRELNVVGPSLSPIVEPRLQAASATAWFGAAEPSTVDTIEYAYLEGHDGVFTETRQGFEVDGIQVKCRHVVGVKAIDWRGLYKNAGAAPSAYPGA